jgi:hypothetical protein
MRPRTPDELGTTSLESEGMMFVGDKGIIVGGFRNEDPKLYPESKMSAYLNGQAAPKEKVVEGGPLWIEAFKNKTQSPGSFLNAGVVTEMILLGAVALRAKKKIEYDSASMRITNNEDANKFLYREYRKGWEL